MLWGTVYIRLSTPGWHEALPSMVHGVEVIFTSEPTLKHGNWRVQFVAVDMGKRLTISNSTEKEPGWRSVE